MAVKQIKVCCICREPVEMPALSLKQQGKRGRNYHYCRKCAANVCGVSTKEFDRLALVKVPTGCTMEVNG